MVKSIQKYTIQIITGTALVVLWLLIILPESASLQLKNWSDGSQLIEKLISKDEVNSLKRYKIKEIRVKKNAQTGMLDICTITGEQENQNDSPACIQGASVGFKRTLPAKDGVRMLLETDNNYEVETLIFAEKLDQNNLQHLNKRISNIINVVSGNQ